MNSRGAGKLSGPPARCPHLGPTRLPGVPTHAPTRLPGVSPVLPSVFLTRLPGVHTHVSTACQVFIFTPALERLHLFRASQPVTTLPACSKQTAQLLRRQQCWALAVTTGQSQKLRRQHSWPLSVTTGQPAALAGSKGCWLCPAHAQSAPHSEVDLLLSNSACSCSQSRPRVVVTTYHSQLEP